MASYDVLREIVRNGSDLALCEAISYDVLTELAALAKQSGARLTVPTSMSYDLILQLSATYGKSVSFIDGLDAFKKGK